MKFKVLVEYEYPIEHKIPVKAELILHGDRVATDNIKWVEQEPILDKIRAEIEDWQTDVRDNDAEIYDFIFERIYEIFDEYKAESEE